MATIEENHRFWNDQFSWTRRRGDQWSRNWGGPEAQWRWCVYPRIRSALPAGTVLEIGPGMGRWTHFLRSHSKKLVLVDISEKCLSACQERFGSENMTYELGDGRSLNFQADESVDFCFSFESLIHTDLPDLTSYLEEIHRVLSPGATCFLHHSNLGSYKTYYSALERIPKNLCRSLQERGLLDFDGWRASSVSYLDVQKAAHQCGLSVLSQELVPWGGKRLIDCFTVMKKGQAERPYKLRENRKFAKRADEIRALSKLYE